MKEEINLLPPTALKERTLGIYNKRFNRLYVVSIVGVLVIAATYGGLYWFYSQSLRSLNTEIQSAKAQDESIENEVRDVNRLLGGITDRTGKESWTPYIDDVLVRVPAGVTITAMELRAPQVNATSAGERLVLTGQSQSRSAIVEYERQLRSLSWIGDVDAPLQNLASGPQVRFSFTITRAQKVVETTSPSPSPGGTL